MKNAINKTAGKSTQSPSSKSVIISSYSSGFKWSMEKQSDGTAEFEALFEGESSSDKSSSDESGSDESSSELNTLNQTEGKKEMRLESSCEMKNKEVSKLPLTDFLPMRLPLLITDSRCTLFSRGVQPAKSLPQFIIRRVHKP